MNAWNGGAITERLSAHSGFFAAIFISALGELDRRPELDFGLEETWRSSTVLAGGDIFLGTMSCGLDGEPSGVEFGRDEACGLDETEWLLLDRFMCFNELFDDPGRFEATRRESDGDG